MAKNTAQAKAAAKAVKKGTKTTGKAKFRPSVHFHRPKTLIKARDGRYARRSAPRLVKMDANRILKNPLATEKAMEALENNNTLTFLVDLKSNKHQIKKAIKDVYDVEVAKVNTLVRPDGQKKALIHLQPDHDAVDIANKIGLI